MTRKKIENYFPVKKVLKSSGINNKLTNEPLFPNYIFVKTAEKHLNNLRKITGIVSLVYWLGDPVIINDNEVKIMERFLSDHVNITVEKMTLRNEITNFLDTSITIYDGNLMTIKNKTFNIILPSLGYVLIAQAETSNVRIISSDNIVRRPGLMSSRLLKPVVNFNNFLKN